MLIDCIKIVQLGAKKEFQVLAHSQLDLVRLELLENFFKQSYVRKACCWNILPFFPSVVFQDCSDLVLLWPQETEKKKKLMKKEGEIQRGGCFPVVAACLQSDSGNLYWIWKLLVPKSSSVTMQGNGISQCQGPFVDPCNRAGRVAFVLEAALCLVQSLFVVF